MRYLIVVSGPGAGSISAGAGHGGRAGQGNNQYEKTGSPYGLFNAPVQFGSGGGGSCGGAGGGVLSIDIKQTLSVEGKSSSFLLYCIENPIVNQVVKNREKR